MVTPVCVYNTYMLLSSVSMFADMNNVSLGHLGVLAKYL